MCRAELVSLIKERARQKIELPSGQGLGPSEWDGAVPRARSLGSTKAVVAFLVFIFLIRRVLT